MEYKYQSQHISKTVFLAADNEDTSQVYYINHQTPETTFWKLLQEPFGKSIRDFISSLYSPVIGTVGDLNTAAL